MSNLLFAIVRKKRQLAIPVFILLFLLTGIGANSVYGGQEQKIVLPLSLDYQLLSSLLVQESFPEKGQSATLVGEVGGCVYVKLSEPEFAAKNELVQLKMQLFIRAGKRLGDKCLLPVEWQGYVQLSLYPLLDAESFQLHFEIIDSELLTSEGGPASVASMLWRFGKPKVHQHLEAVHLDLAPPVTELRFLLVSLFQQEARQSATLMLDTMRGGRVVVEQDRLVAELIAKVEETYKPTPQSGVVALSEQEREKLVRLWETWDSFLVHLITFMAVDPLLPEDRQILMDVLLDARYSLAAALEQPVLEKDMVREQFLVAWQDLAPIFRRQLFSKPSENSLGYLAFFSAADALTVFDTMGPAFGIEISQQGLLRLAEMLTGESLLLPYSQRLNSELRDLFNLPKHDSNGSELQEYIPLPEGESIEIPEEDPSASKSPEPLSWMLDYFSSPVYAAGGGKLPSFAEILKWKVPKKNYSDYVLRVRKILDKERKIVVAQQTIPKHLQPMFATLIPAMAWQESCFRQFVVKNKKLTYLLSYNKSSVGLMQINERVWRGIYDRNRLRWDIHYNAKAGCEIVDLYLRRYILRHGGWEKGCDTNLLGRALFSIYNGGPGEYKKFLAREKAGTHYKSDLLFAEKLHWAEKKDWNKVRQCLIGG